MAKCMVFYHVWIESYHINAGTLVENQPEISVPRAKIGKSGGWHASS
jgi:hypothetical protein